MEGRVGNISCVGIEYKKMQNLKHTHTVVYVVMSFNPCIFLYCPDYLSSIQLSNSVTPSTTDTIPLTPFSPFSVAIPWRERTISRCRH